MTIVEIILLGPAEGGTSLFLVAESLATHEDGTGLRLKLFGDVFELRSRRNVAIFKQLTAKFEPCE